MQKHLIGMNISISTREMEEINGLAVTQMIITYSFFMMVSVLSNFLQTHFRKMDEKLTHMAKKADTLYFP